MEKITIEIKVTNQYGQEFSDKWVGEYDKVYNNEWDEITKGLIDESTSQKEF